MQRAITRERKRKLGLMFLVVLASFFLVVWSAAFAYQREDQQAIAPDSAQAASGEAVVFGYSEQGTAIEGKVFGNGPNRLFLIAGIHGNEKGAVALLERLAQEIEANPLLVSSDTQVIILPIANPDGYFAREDKLNANNVNLNRNFATTRWTPYEEDIFGGTEPFSESESRVIKEIVQAYQPNMMIAFHSQGGLTVPELTDEGSIELAQWYAEHTGYEYYDEWDYSGTATGWFMETTGHPAITVELTTHTDSDWEINKAALLKLTAE